MLTFQSLTPDVGAAERSRYASALAPNAFNTFSVQELALDKLVLLRGLELQLGHRLVDRGAIDGEHGLGRDDRVFHVAEPRDRAHGAGVDHAVLDEPVVDVDADDLAEH